MNTTLFQKVIELCTNNVGSQYAIAALLRGGMAHNNKFIWEFLIIKREWLMNNDVNSLKQWNSQKWLDLKSCKNRQVNKWMRGLTIE